MFVRWRFPDFHQEAPELLSCVILCMKLVYFGHHINNYYKYSRRCMVCNVMMQVRKVQESILKYN